MKVTVLGSGNGAYALAFHLVQLGHEVLIHTPEEFKDDIQAVENAGCIESIATYDGKQSPLHGISKISMVTTSIKVAVEFSSVIMLIVPSFGQKSIFEIALPYLNEKHIWISLPGNFAFIDYVDTIKKTSSLDVAKDLPFTMVETSSIPYACRKVGANRVFINGVKHIMEVGVYPSCRTKATVEVIKSLFSLELSVQQNVAAAGFCNLNFVLHPSIMTYNAGWVESTGGNFLFYKQGATPGIFSIMKKLDDERLAMAKSIGIDLQDLLTIWKGWYGDKTSRTLEEFVKNAEFYSTITAPSTLRNRYYTEDLSYVLIPLVEYFKKHSIPCPAAEAIITSARYLSNLELKNQRSFEMFPRSMRDI